MRRQLLSLLACAVAAGCVEMSGPAPGLSSPPPPEPDKQMIQRVGSMEIGRTFNGVNLTAYGLSDSIGWRDPELRPRGAVPGPDGIINLEFVARPPVEAKPGPVPVRLMRADIAFDMATMRQSRGVRIEAREGALQAAF